MLELKTSYHDGILNIELYGALDSLTAPDFKHWLTQKSAGGYHHFALNCGGLEFISSRGISVLTELNNILNATESRLVLYHVTNEVMNLLAFLKLSGNMPIVENFSKAKERFEKNPPQKSPENEPVMESRDEALDNHFDKAFDETLDKVQKDSTDQDFHHGDIRAATVGVVKMNEVGPADHITNRSTEHNYTGISTSTENRPEENPSAQVEDGSSNTSTTTVQSEIREEYIDLNQWERENTQYDVTRMNVVFCPNCGQNLRVQKKGLYLCPECRSKFNYPF